MSGIDMPDVANSYFYVPENNWDLLVFLCFVNQRVAWVEIKKATFRMMRQRGGPPEMGRPARLVTGQDGFFGVSASPKFAFNSYK